MPLRAARPIVRVEPGSMHTIETKEPENLFGLWSLFAKCSPAMEDGTRYENMAWRLWGRETFCCAPDHVLQTRYAFERRVPTDRDVPDLSSSVESDVSRSEGAPTTTTSTTFRSNSSICRADHRRAEPTERRQHGKQTHITPIDLEKVVNSIQEKKDLEPLSPLPPQLSQTLSPQQTASTQDTTPRPASPPPSARFIPESSSSTVATALGSEGMSPTIASDVTASTDMSTHSVVKGFVPGQVSTSIRSCSSLHDPPHPTLKAAEPSRLGPKAEPIKKKAPIFTLGGSSDEDNNSSFETNMYMSKHGRSSLSDSLKKTPLNKKTSFKPEVMLKTIRDAVSSEESEDAIETDSEEDSDDPAIEDDDSDDWEDDDNSGPSSINDKELFQRVDSRAHLTSHRSLLTDLMNEGDRAQAMLKAASRSTPAIRRSRTSTPNGPSTGNSPQEGSGISMMRPQVPGSKPIIMTTSNVHPPTLSPRTTRRNMLQTEMTESLRKNLLWERQQRSTRGPILRRSATTNDMNRLNDASRPYSHGHGNAIPGSLNNQFFDQGLQEYHQKGW